MGGCLYLRRFLLMASTRDDFLQCHLTVRDVLIRAMPSLCSRLWVFLENWFIGIVFGSSRGSFIGTRMSQFAKLIGNQLEKVNGIKAVLHWGWTPLRRCLQALVLLCRSCIECLHVFVWHKQLFLNTYSLALSWSILKLIDPCVDAFILPPSNQETSEKLTYIFDNKVP